MITELLSQSWGFFKIHFNEIVAIIFPFVIPVEVFVALYEYFVLTEHSSFLDRLVPYAAPFLVYPVFEIALIFYVASVITDKPISISSALRLGIRFWIPYIVLTILIILVVGLGIVLLIIPGIYFVLKLLFASFELLLKGKKPIESLESSWERTKGYVGKLLGGGLIIFGIFYIPYWILGSLFDSKTTAYLLFYTMGNILASLMGAVFIIFVFRVYWLAGEQHNKSLNTDPSRAGAG